MPTKKPPPRPQNLIDRVRITMNQLGFPNKSREATSWLMDKYKQLHIGTNSIMKPGTVNLSKIVGRPEIGKMYHFSYDAKHKATLPFYDRFPLIICVGGLEDGFHGINLHYLPPMARVGLLSNLESIANNTRWDQTTKLRISYEVLSSTAKFDAFRPCFKRYLNSHVQSSFLFIPPEEWEIACFIPSERFVMKNGQFGVRNKIWNQG